MPKVTLSFISTFNERLQPLMDGTVQAEGLEIIPTYSYPAETFWRQLKFQEFEVSEMSLSSSHPFGAFLRPGVSGHDPEHLWR
jgi:4,5-dihydroxyphthalate decarboxylase